MNIEEENNTSKSDIEQMFQNYYPQASERNRSTYEPHVIPELTRETSIEGQISNAPNNTFDDDE